MGLPGLTLNLAISYRKAEILSSKVEKSSRIKKGKIGKIQKFEKLILCDISRSTGSGRVLDALLLLGTCVYVYATYTTFQGPTIIFVMSGMF